MSFVSIAEFLFFGRYPKLFKDTCMLPLIWPETHTVEPASVTYNIHGLGYSETCIVRPPVLKDHLYVSVTNDGPLRPDSQWDGLYGQAP